jgi:hypothetical protein
MRPLLIGLLVGGMSAALVTGLASIEPPGDDDGGLSQLSLALFALMVFTLSTPAMVGDRLLFGEGRRSTLAQVTVAWCAALLVILVCAFAGGDLVGRSLASVPTLVMMVVLAVRRIHAARSSR